MNILAINAMGSGGRHPCPLWREQAKHWGITQLPWEIIVQWTELLWDLMVPWWVQLLQPSAGHAKIAAITSLFVKRPEAARCALFLPAAGPHLC